MPSGESSDRVQVLQAMGIAISETLIKWFPSMEPMDVHLLSMECAQAGLGAIAESELRAAQEFISALDPGS
jgi:hypothetical protein